MLYMLWISPALHNFLLHLRNRWLCALSSHKSMLQFWIRLQLQTHDFQGKWLIYFAEIQCSDDLWRDVHISTTMLPVTYGWTWWERHLVSMCHVVKLVTQFAHVKKGESLIEWNFSETQKTDGQPWHLFSVDSAMYFSETRFNLMFGDSRAYSTCCICIYIYVCVWMQM